MKASDLAYLYQNVVYLDYLRHNPKFYEIIAQTGSLSVFLNQANIDLKLTLKDRVENINKKLKFASGIFDYIKK